MLKILQTRLQQYVNWELRDVQAGFRKAEEPEINFQHPLDHRKSKKIPEKHLLLLYWLCQNLWLCSAQLLTHVQPFVTQWTALCQASLSINNSWSLPKLMSVELVMPSNHLILCHPFSSRLQSFPASGSFPMSQLFASGGRNIGVSASASVFPMNIQDWFP